MMVMHPQEWEKISANKTTYKQLFSKVYKQLLQLNICLLRNLYVGQEATVRTGHGTTDLFQIGRGVHQGCILSPCLFNIYAEYIRVHHEIYCIFCSTLSYLKQLFWILPWINHRSQIFRGEYWRFLYFLGVIILWVHIPWSFVVLFSN